LSYVPEFIQELGEIPLNDNKTYLLSFFNNLYNGDGYVIKNLDYYRNIFGIVIKIAKQRDSHEYLIKFLERLGIRQNYFNFIINEERRCIYGPIDGETDVGTVTVPNNYMLELVIKYGSIATSISELIAENLDIPEGGEAIARCRKSNGEANGPYSQRDSYIFEDTNKYLIIHLKRFRSDLTKIDTRISIDNTITIGDTVFTIYGSIVHTGGSTGGHYRFYKINSTNIIEYNDSHVNVRALEDIRVKNDIDSNSYVLIYKKNIMEGGNSNYKKKYLKYKTKYLKLKRNI
jgi:hypothetical protein